jgi:mannosyl-3-phosphoglycerate phosphatase family protein
MTGREADAAGPALLVATDLDGCLLDESSYEFDAARPALRLLSQRRVPLVLATSKTRAETEPLARALGARCELIVENGGAVLVPDGLLRNPPPQAALVDGYWTVVLDGRRSDHQRALDAIALRAGAALRSFASLHPAEVQQLTGLGPEAARLAQQREYSEPFLIESPGRAQAVVAAAEALGLRLTPGGRFWHLRAGTDKGRALKVLLDLRAAEGQRFTVVALGDAPNDLSLLRAAHRPVVMPHRDQGIDPLLRSELPLAECAPAAGPGGWNAAVLAVLHGERLPTVSGALR